MPTGYTHKVASGEITKFDEFVWDCARAFGAMITLRDTPMDGKQPEEFVADPYYGQKLADAKRRYDELRDMTAAEIEAARDKAQQEVIDAAERMAEKDRETRERYETMLSKVEAWEPPTSEHVALRDFMLSQLKQSIDFDCHERPTVVKKLPPAMEWWEQELDKINGEIQRYRREVERENALVEGRNRWVKQLAGSLFE